jgi:hypothetical protein
MAKIVAVHGIGQQFKGDAILHREWWPAFVGGLHLAGRDLADEREFVCPFYGHCFRRAGILAAGDHFQVEDVREEEAVWLDLLWDAAVEAEPGAVPSRADYECARTLARTPQLVQRALNAVSRSKFWANISQGMLIGDLKQVVSYLNDADVHEKVLKVVVDKITPDTKVVIGHSLGSVVAYEALCRKPESVVSFISLGSPLGIRNLIFDKLSPRPDANGTGAWPGRVEHWTNIAEKGDLAALQKRLASLFGSRVKDLLIYNGSDAHHGESYLTARETGEAASEGLWERSS